MAQPVKRELVAKEANNGLMSLSELIETKDIQETIAKTLGKNRVQTFVGSALTMAQLPTLKDVEPNSLFNCLLKTAAYNLPLDPSLGFAYCVPYKNKDGSKIGQFQLGAKGFVELAYRTNKYKRLNVKEVKASEIVGIDFFGEEQIKWDNSPDRDKKQTIGYMAAFELTNGMTKRIYWSNEKILAHANKYSKAHQYAIKSHDTGDDLWANNFDAMARKTVLKSLIAQFGPKSIELQNAIRFDQSVIERKNGVEKPVYVDADNKTDVDEDKVYDIDTTTGEVLDATANPVEQPKIEEPKNEQPSTDGVIEVWYSEYKNSPDKYEAVLLPNGEQDYNAQKKTIKVRLKQ